MEKVTGMLNNFFRRTIADPKVCIVALLFLLAPTPAYAAVPAIIWWIGAAAATYFTIPNGFIAILATLGTIFTILGFWMLRLSGYIFDTLVSHVVVGFGQTITTLSILDGIHLGWEVMRDVSNIVIIGMFVFIAISMILGIEQFGAKKFVAHVLVIAILINFSLLFSKLIIDAGNFAAYQIHAQMSGSNTALNTDPSVTWGTADQFIQALSISSIMSPGVATTFGQNVANNAGGITGTLQGAVAAFMYGAVAGMLLLGVAALLFYGSYLIAVRAVLLIFLMMMSAFAFASYLIPKLSESGYGWSTWWRSLINASVFGPILMLLLFLTLTIVSAAAEKTRSGGETLADFMANPANVEKNWKLIVINVIGIGMLYASFRIANSFSQKIAGFGAASGSLLTALGAVTSPAALLARSTFGRYGAGRLDVMKNRIAQEQQVENMRAAREGRDPNIITPSRSQLWAARGFQKLGKSTFDPFRVGPVAAEARRTGAMLVGGGEGGFVGTKERQAANADAIARSLTESRTDAQAREQRRIQDERQHEAEKKKAELNRISTPENAKGVRDEAVKNVNDGKGEMHQFAKEVARGVVQQQVKGGTRDQFGALQGNQATTDAARAQQISSSERLRIERARGEADKAALSKTLGTNPAQWAAELERRIKNDPDSHPDVQNAKQKLQTSIEKLTQEISDLEKGERSETQRKTDDDRIKRAGDQAEDRRRKVAEKLSATPATLGIWSDPDVVKRLQSASSKKDMDDAYRNFGKFFDEFRKKAQTPEPPKPNGK